jgi:DNA-binding NtrC family response regulator
VLVVDDEESVRGLAERALGRLGYRVSTCEDGLEAVAFFARHHADVDLVILDLIMPNLGGEDTFHRLREIDPQARVLVASGFSHHRTVDVLLEQGALGFLSKPFRIDTLAHEVAQLLPPAAARDGGPEPDARAGRAT